MKQKLSPMCQIPQELLPPHKHPAVVLADTITTGGNTSDALNAAANMLRRIPDLEAQCAQGLREILALETEVQEQARIIGMGAERELVLMSKIERLEAETAHVESYKSRLFAALDSEPILKRAREQIDDCRRNPTFTDMSNLLDVASANFTECKRLQDELTALRAQGARVPDDGLISKDRFYGDDHIQDIAHALAQECEAAELDPNDFVTVNREKLAAIAKRVLEKASEMLSPAPTCGAVGAMPLPDILFDGFAVWQSLSDSAKKRTSAQNVSDVLDAVVRCMRATQPTDTPQSAPSAQGEV